MNQTDIGPYLICKNCGNLAFEDYRYCGSCGHKKEERKEAYLSPIESREFKLAMVFIALELLVLILYKFTNVFDELQSEFEFMDTFLHGYTVIFAALAGWSALRIKFKPLSFKISALVISSAVAAAFCVDFIADFINFNLVDDYYEFSIYTYQGLAYSIFFTAVLPAIFEELAYRGFLFSQLKSISNVNTALVVTSIVFGLAHFSFVSLLWLIPLGYSFGWLRLKYDTILYGVLGHFIYNSTIVLIDFYAF